MSRRARAVESDSFFEVERLVARRERPHGGSDGGETEEPRAGRWRSFGEALEFAHSLGLPGHKEWYEWCKSAARPADIPTNPRTVYAGQGWQSYSHWLGTGWRPFSEALEYVHSLGLSGTKAWDEWCKSGARPTDIPTNPNRVYAGQGWQGYGHWLGTGNVRGGRRSAKRAQTSPASSTRLPRPKRARVDSAGESCLAADQECDGNREPKKRQQPSHEQAGPYGVVRWMQRMAKPSRPLVPRAAKRRCWVQIEPLAAADEGETEEPRAGRWRPFGEALEFVHLLGLPGRKAWCEWRKSDARPADIPSSPERVYAGQGWQCMGHWLGTGNGATRDKEFRPFGEALEFARSLGLPGQKEWYEWRKSGARPADIPSSPERVYAGQGWQCMGHWLGTGNVATRDKEFRPFGEALEFARSLGLPGQKEWREWNKSDARPADIPSSPERVYAGQGWQGYGHWLGTGSVRGSRRSAKRAQTSPASSTRLPRPKRARAESKDESHLAAEEAGDAFEEPRKRQQQSKLAPRQSKFRSFVDALALVRSLELCSLAEWREWSKSDSKPADIPARPHMAYARQGWQSYDHWLGILINRNVRIEI